MQNHLIVTSSFSRAPLTCVALLVAACAGTGSDDTIDLRENGVDDTDDALPFIAFAAHGTFDPPTTHDSMRAVARIAALSDGTSLRLDPPPDFYHVPPGCNGDGTCFLAAAGDAIELNYDGTLTGLTVHSDKPIVGEGGFEATAGRPLRGSYAFGGDRPTATSVSLPLVMRSNPTASGLSETDIFLQNAHDATQDVALTLVRGGDGAVERSYQLAPGALVRVPVGELVAGPWVGSAEVSGSSGPIRAVVNVYTDERLYPEASWASSPVTSLMTYEGMADKARDWVIPLMASALPNGFNTPLAVQNRGTATLSPGSIRLTCKDTQGETFVDMTNHDWVGVGASTFFNPVVDSPEAFPDEKYGTCVVRSSQEDISVFEMARIVGGVASASGAFEVFPVRAGDHSVVDLAIARAVRAPGAQGAHMTAATLVNLTDHRIDGITVTYEPGGHVHTLSLEPFANEIENGYLTKGVEAINAPLADGRTYVMKVHSPDGAIGVFNQVKRYGDTEGDSFAAYDGVPYDAAADAQNVDVSLRCFIPAPAAVAPDVWGFEYYHADDYDPASYRALERMRLVPGTSASRELFREYGVSHQYSADSTFTVTDKPSWYRGLVDAPTILATGQQDKSSLVLFAAPVGDARSTVHFEVDGKLVLNSVAPPINGIFDMTVERVDPKGPVRYWISGVQDSFPAYEFMIRVGSDTPARLRVHDPLWTGDVPTALFPPMERTIAHSGLVGPGLWKQELDTLNASCQNTSGLPADIAVDYIWIDGAIVWSELHADVEAGSSVWFEPQPDHFPDNPPYALVEMLALFSELRAVVRSTQPVTCLSK